MDFIWPRVPVLCENVSFNNIPIYREKDRGGENGPFTYRTLRAKRVALANQPATHQPESWMREEKREIVRDRHLKMFPHDAWSSSTSLPYFLFLSARLFCSFPRLFHSSTPLWACSSPLPLPHIGSQWAFGIFKWIGKWEESPQRTGRGCPGKGGAMLELGRGDWVSGQKQPILLLKKCQGCISAPETVRISIWHPVRFLCAHVLHRALVCEKRALDGLLLLCKIQFQLFKLLIALCFPSSWVCVYVCWVWQCILSRQRLLRSSHLPTEDHL